MSFADDLTNIAGTKKTLMEIVTSKEIRAGVRVKQNNIYGYGTNTSMMKLI